MRRERFAYPYSGHGLEIVTNRGMRHGHPSYKRWYLFRASYWSKNPISVSQALRKCEVRKKAESTGVSFLFIAI
jgi:hypothetical protein